MTTNKEKTKNSYHVNIKKCCASCRYKEVTRLVTTRKCKKKKKRVSPHDQCDDWELNDTLKQFRPFDQEW